jgi:hypothetical protein
MTAKGTLYLLPPLVLLTGEIAYGSLPTPSATVYGSNQSPTDGAAIRLSLDTMARKGLLPTPTAGDSKASGSRNTTTSKAHPGTSLTDWVRGDGGTGRMWQTPVADDAVERKKGKWNSRGEPKLSAQVMLWPTPTSSSGGLEKAKANGEGSTTGLKLASAVQMWPTPASRDFRHPNAEPYSERGGGTKGEQLPNAAGGPLNPTWVEWLMGFPIGWTDLKPSEMPSSRKSRK